MLNTIKILWIGKVLIQLCKRILEVLLFGMQDFDEKLVGLAISVEGILKEVVVVNVFRTEGGLDVVEKIKTLKIRKIF